MLIADITARSMTVYNIAQHTILTFNKHYVCMHIHIYIYIYMCLVI